MNPYSVHPHGDDRYGHPKLVPGGLSGVVACVSLLIIGFTPEDEDFVKRVSRRGLQKGCQAVVGLDPKNLRHLHIRHTNRLDEAITTSVSDPP